MKIIVFFAALIMMSTSLFATSPSQGTLIIAGYNGSGSLLYQSTNSGNSWIGQAFNVPGYGFETSSCTGSGASTVCVAAGSNVFVNVLNPSQVAAIFADTKNNGQSWNVLAHDQTQPFGLNINFNSSSCTDGNLCIAGGGTCDFTSPVLVETQDGGNTWSVVANHATQPFKYNGIIENTSCTGSFCVAVGDQPVNTVIGQPSGPPLLVQSQDGGKTWNAISNDSTTPFSTSAGSFNEISCTGTGSNAMCIAGGQDATNPFLEDPLLVETTNGGNSWSVVANQAIPRFTSQGGLILGVSCALNKGSTLCVAGGGAYATNDSLFVESQDNGQSWIPAPGAALPQGTIMNTIACTGDASTAAMCVDTGATLPSYAPVVVETQDGGNTWENVKVPAFPSGYTINLISAQCTGSGTTARCIIGGTAVLPRSNPSMMIPLSIISTDGGTTWSAVNGLPNNAQVLSVSTNP